MGKRSVPDFYEYAAKGYMFQDVNLSEHAVRLGSVNIHNRSGNVIFIDSFENGLYPYAPVALGIGANVAVVSEYTRNGKYAAKLTTGHVLEDSTWVYKMIGYPFIDKTGFEVSFSIGIEPPDIYMSIYFFTGTEALLGEIKIDIINGSIYYMTSDGIYLPIVDGLVFFNTYAAFYTCKLVVDPEGKKYKNFLLGSLGYDLSNYGLYPVDFVSAPYLAVRMGVASDITNNLIAYFDDFIITINEL